MLSVSSKTNQFVATDWGAWRGFMMVAVSFIAGQAIGVGVALLIAALHGTITGQAGSDFINSTVGDFLYTAIAESLTLGILWLFLSKRKNAWTSIGLTGRPKILDPAYALIAWASYFVALIVISGVAQAWLGLDTSKSQDLGFTSQGGGNHDIVLIFMSLVIFPPIVEEILFRGVLFSGLRKRLPFIVSALLTSVLFGALHLSGGTPGSGALWIAGLDTMLLSFALCYLREKTGSLWACIFLHMLKNTVACIYLFVL